MLSPRRAIPGSRAVPRAVLAAGAEGAHSEGLHRPQQTAEQGRSRMGPWNYLSCWGAAGLGAGDPLPACPDLREQETQGCG